LFVRSDYAAAGIPMLPIVAGLERTRRQIFLYTLPMAAAAVAPWPLGLTGLVYGACAAVLSFVFLVLAARVATNRATDPVGMDAEKHLFAYSVFYLFALFAVLAVDRFLA
jgi:protoheme IX farnesyltransferase